MADHGQLTSADPRVGRAATIDVLDERLRRATAVARVLVYDADLESGKTAVHGFEELIGFRPSPENTSGTFWHSRIHADDLALHLEELEQQCQAGGIRRIRYRIRHASDRWLYVEDTREIVLDADGRAKRILGAIVDETERTERELAIRRSEAEFRSLFENTGIANAEVDLATMRFVRVNRRYCELVGYSAEELLGGMTFVDLTHPDDRERNLSAFAASDNGRLEITKRYVRKDGSIVWIQLSSTPVYCADGHARHMLGSAIDVTARQTASDAVRAAAEQLRFITDHVPVLIIHCDTEARYRFVNAPYAARFGLSPDQVVGKHIADVLGDEAYESIRSYVEAAKRGESAEFEQQIPYRYGTRWMHCEYVPERDSVGRVVGFVAVIQDVTDRHEAVEALRNSERLLQDRNTLLRLALQASPAMVFEWDIKSHRVRRVVSALEGLPTNPDWEPFEAFEHLVHPDDRSLFHRNLANAIASDTGIYRSEFRIRFQDDEEHWLEDHGRFERDAEGRPERLIGIALDITDRKRIEEGLKRELRTNEMFVGVLSHDLRNPLGGILMAAELGLENAQTVAVKRTFDRIAHSARRMLRMIEQLLDLTRIRMTHGLELRRVPSNLAAISDAVVEELKAANPTAELVLEVLGDMRGCWDPDRLAQLVSNLVGNAIQHASGSRRVVILMDGTDASVVKLCVHNYGTISANVRPVLFEPFKRSAHDGTKTAGLGLGLYVAKQVALAHGGDLQAQSGPERGTTFELVLPREHREPAKTCDATSDVQLMRARSTSAR